MTRTDLSTDAQKALDQMLTEAEQRGYANAMKDADQRISKAREDAIREAAEQCEKERWNTSLLMSNPPQSDAARMIGLRILALLNDGEDDGKTT